MSILHFDLRDWALTALFAHLALSPLGCSEPEPGDCQSDEDCAMGEHCNLFVGRCLAGEATPDVRKAALHERCSGSGACADGNCQGTEAAAACLMACQSHADCERDDPGTRCVEFASDVAVCLWPCAEDTDCNEDWVCEGGDCVLAEWVAGSPACDASSAGTCDAHVATRCDAGVATQTDCAAAGQLCRLGVDGQASCVAAPDGECANLCARIESCGVCVQAEGQCVTPVNCEAQCTEQRFNTLCSAETQTCDEATLQACVDKDPFCVEAPDLALCLGHATVTCVVDELVVEDCGAQAQLCDGTSGVPVCVPQPVNACERLCGMIHSCGFCTQQDGECVSVDDCIEICSESTWTTDCRAAETCDEAGILECLMLSPALQ